MKTAACYVRVSTEDQTEYSPDAQLRDIENYAKKNNIKILPQYIYREDGVSGRTAAKRTQFQKLITAAKQKPKPFDVVLIHAYDRFARNVKESRIYKELLRQDLGIEIISITEDFGQGKNAFLLEGIKDILNEYYSLNLRDEVLKGMKEKATRGGVQAIAALGYKVVNNQYVIVEEEAKYIRMIYENFLKGDNCFHIARHLNDIGLTTHRGNPIENRTVQYILSNPVYKGYIRFTPGKDKSNTILAKGSFEPIISEEIWEKTQSELKMRRTHHKKKSRPHTEYHDWLSGLIKCSTCGSSMIINNPYMICNGYAKGRCTNRNSVRTEKIRQIILNQLFIDAQKTIHHIHPIIKKNDIDKQINKLEKRKKLIYEKEKRAKHAYINGIDTLDEYTKNKKDIKEEADIISAEIQDLLQQSKDTTVSVQVDIKSALQILADKQADLQLKITIIHSIIDYCVYDKEKDHLTIYYHL